MRALAAVDQLESEVTTGLISQLISRGYDSDELLKLSDGKISGYRRGIHLIMLIAHSCPDFKSKVLMTHIGVFARRVLQDKFSTPV